MAKKRISIIYISTTTAICTESTEYSVNEWEADIRNCAEIEYYPIGIFIDDKFRLGDMTLHPSSFRGPIRYSDPNGTILVYEKKILPIIGFPHKVDILDITELIEIITKVN